jgi:hypothetical protein
MFLGLSEERLCKRIALTQYIEMRSFAPIVSIRGKFVPLVSELSRAPQPPLAYPSAILDSNRAKKPPLCQSLDPISRIQLNMGNFDDFSV